MSIATARKSVKPAATIPGLDGDVLPVKQLVSSPIVVDGRTLQAITEFWAEKPADVVSHEDPATGTWFTSRIYDPFDQVFFAAS